MTQETALNIMKTGANVFLTGEPGAGKSYVVNQYVAWLEAAGLTVAVTASTGIAATHIGGFTIHSWSGIGVRDTLTPADLDQIIGKERVVKRLQKTDTLIIDEISMLEGTLLDHIDKICRTARHSSEPFGGMQIILVGDFFQLPPIVRGGGIAKYAFMSQAWHNARFLVCYLSEQFRQEDEMLLSLLSSIRQGEVEEEHYTLLSEQKDIAYEGIEPTRLYTHNADVDAVNLAKLNELSGGTKVYHMTGKGNKLLLDVLKRTCLSPERLTLKSETMVMCTKNNFEVGYANGTLARVIDFSSEGWPVVETTDERTLTIEPVSWEVQEDGKILASIEQVPLRLAWAITVHKSQGMSLDAAEVDLSKSFVYGQGYVALSRVRSLAGLKVLGMNPNALMVDPTIINEDERFRAEATAAEETFLALEDEELKTMHERFVKAKGGQLPVGEIVPGQRAKKVPPPSTYEVTMKLVREGKSVAEIAAERGITAGTIITHLETLAEAGELTPEEIKSACLSALPDRVVMAEIQTALDKHGSEKLKPIFEATGEKYDYHTLRLCRLVLTN